MKIVDRIVGSAFVLLFLTAPPQLPASAKHDAEAVPWSKAELKSVIKGAALIAHGRIIAYTPPSFDEKEHTGSPERTSLLIAESLRGPFRTGHTLAYLCICSGDSSSTPERMIGSDVIVFLTYDKSYQYCKPYTETSRLPYSTRVWQEISTFTRRTK